MRSPKTKPKADRFRSGLEKGFYKAAKEYMLPFTYEPSTIPYTVERKYLPDFVWDAKGVIIECKGFFRAGDTQKYKAIKDCLPEGKELIFVLSDPNKKVTKGAKQTMASWCDKHDIKYYTLETIEELFEYVVNSK